MAPPTSTRQIKARGLRTVWDGQTDHPAPLVPEIAMLGQSAFPRTMVHGLTPHRHETFEICLITDGAVDWWVEGEGVYSLHRNDLFVTRPGELHGGVDTMMHPCELVWVQIADADLPGLDADAARYLLAGLRDLPRRQFAASDLTAAPFHALVAEHTACRDGGADLLAPIAARAALHRLLVQVLRDGASDGGGASEVTPPLSPSIGAAVGWMEAHLAEPFAIEAAAHSVGLSVSRFHERFVAETGQTPADWRVRRRVEHAKRRLELPGASVTEVAFALGFTSSQYFATAFKKYTGRTPREWQRLRPDGQSF